MRFFKEIICDDISEFESYHPRQAVGSLAASSGLQKYVRMTHLHENCLNTLAVLG